MSIAWILAMVAATAAPQEQSARIDRDLPPYWTGTEGWRVFSYPDEEMCDLGFPTASGEYVTVGYHARGNMANLLVTNSHATSLRAGEIRKLVVTFGSKSAITSTRPLDFEATLVGDQMALSAATTYATFLEDFSKADVMAVLTARMVPVSAIRLTGSGEAIAQLRSCAMSAARLDPRDPFLRK